MEPVTECFKFQIRLSTLPLLEGFTLQNLQVMFCTLGTMASDKLWAHVYQAVSIQKVPLFPKFQFFRTPDKEHDWVRLSHITILGEKVQVGHKNGTPQ